jgi:DNA-binding response OmpR family regulator
MLPDCDGFALCTQWRQQGVSAPILFLTACDDEVQVVRGLDAGGDDYITKPFRLQELLSRIRALLRRVQTAAYSHDGLVIDTAKMTATRDGAPVFVTPTEFQLLSVLIRNPGRILTRKMLLQAIWDDAEMYIEDNTLSVHISRLREKIGGGRIKTVRGVGYSWEERA